MTNITTRDSAKQQRRAAAVEKAKVLNIDLIYPLQSYYKTIYGFVRAYGTPRFSRAVRAVSQSVGDLYCKQMVSECSDDFTDRCKAVLGQCDLYLRQMFFSIDVEVEA